MHSSLNTISESLSSISYQLEWYNIKWVATQWPSSLIMPRVKFGKNLKARTMSSILHHDNLIGVEKWIYNLPFFFYVSEKIVFLFQLLARQANSSLEANSDKRFFNVQYRKNLDNLCAPQKDFNLKKSTEYFNTAESGPKRKILRAISFDLAFVCSPPVLVQFWQLYLCLLEMWRHYLKVLKYWKFQYLQ